MTEVKATKENLAVAYASLMRQYFHLVRTVLGETVKQGNNWMIFSNQQETDWKEYEKKTTWSDFQLILPVLFSLYHGIELSMKALLAINNEKTTGHILSKIYTKIKRIKDIPKTISSLLSKYVENGNGNILSEFTEINKCSVDDYYDFLKYPSDKNFDGIKNYWSIKYKEKSSLPIYEEIISDLFNISKEVQSYIDKKLPNR